MPGDRHQGALADLIGKGLGMGTNYLVAKKGRLWLIQDLGSTAIREKVQLGMLRSRPTSRTGRLDIGLVEACAARGIGATGSGIRAIKEIDCPG